MSEPIQITLFLDGRPGHEKQSLAIIQELHKMINIDVREVALPAVNVLGRIKECMETFSLQRCRSLYGKRTRLFIGTGSRTHLLMLAAGRRCKVPVVTCMAPEPFLRPFFALCCIPRHDGVHNADNILLTDGPPVFQAEIGQMIIRENDAGLILVGGVDEQSHFWDGEQIINSIRAAVCRLPHVTWQMTSSPRTPDETVALLGQLADKEPNVSFTPFRETPRGWLEKQYRRATYALVSADSVSMLYEAVSSGCRVGVLPVIWKHSDNKFKRSIDFLVEKRIVTFCDDDFQTELDELEVGAFNEAGRCAREILLRFFQQSK